MDIPEPLRPLAESCLRGEPGAEQELRAKLEAGLMPLVRSTLRCGVGSPALMRYLNRARGVTPIGPGPFRVVPDPDPDRTAVRLTRLLSAELVQQYRPHYRAMAETVVA